jgi:hypothetical protein
MKKIGYLIASAGTLALPMFASAQLTSGDGGDLEVLMDGILQFVNDFLIPFIIAIGFLVFVWGMFQYFIAGGANDDAKAKGKSLMIYATLGFVLIIVFWGIINLLTQSTGLDNQTVNSTPTITIP